MYKINDIYDTLNTISPFELQGKWDNSGLLVGNMSDTFDTVCLTIDIDDELLESLPKGALIISHHPLIFDPIVRLNYHDMQSRFLYKMIKKDIKLISMHSNFDKTHLNKHLCENILDFRGKQKDDYLYETNIDMDFEKLLNHVATKLKKKSLKFVKTKQNIKNITIICGSGASFLKNISTDCLLTGDIKYHDQMAAKAMGIGLIDIGHFESERHFGELIFANLQDYLKHKEIKVIIPNISNPQQEKTFE
jgi:dinuclear metal center YbgI/SA1388 family protein